jgi:uncharacterized protein (UPF0332 family)
MSTSAQMDPSGQEVWLYIQRAHEMLEVSERNLEDGFHTSAVNRAYYAVFYAACAVLASEGLSRSKHSGVVAAFRRHFIKPGTIEAEYGDIYGRVMDDRHLSDYDIEQIIEPDRARIDLDDAQRFVRRMEQYLVERGVI